MGRDSGITTRHRKSCKSVGGGRCNCSPAYRAEAYDKRTGKRVYQTFPTLAAARNWRSDASREIRQGIRRGPTGMTFRAVAQEWISAAEAETIRNRSGLIYKPSVLRGYRSSLELRLLPEFGNARIENVTRREVQAFADQLLEEGLRSSTIKNHLMPMRAIYRRLVMRGVVAVNPTTNLELPSDAVSRDRIASPAEAELLLMALPEFDRGIWATAMFAGLRSGELQALEWSCVDLASGLIRVEQSYDPRAKRFIEPKSKAGRRRIPIPAILRDYLVEHRMNSTGSGLVFGRSETVPFDNSVVSKRARRIWAKSDLQPIGFHECRHTCASAMIAAGVNAKAITTFLGHSAISITFDRYGHLMPGGEDEALALIDGFYERSFPRQDLSQIEE